MAKIDYTPDNALFEACDALNQAARFAEFIQGITLRTDKNGGIELGPGETTGLYYVMDDLIGRIRKTEALIEAFYKRQREG